MVRKKDRLPVVLDTNVLIANYLSSNPKSPNVAVFRLWRERKLQLIISREVTQEYAYILSELNIAEPLVKKFSDVLEASNAVTMVNLGKRLADSRDPKDNIFLSTAAAGSAKFLLSNDKDLLEIPKAQKRKYKFRILTPAQFLQVFQEQT